MRVCTIGTGYVGLVTGACLAHVGHDVVCVDNDLAKVQLLQSGQSPIYEPGLAEVMRSAIASNRLKFTTDLAMGVDHGEILFIAVGTPSLPNGATNTQYVEAVAKGIGKHLKGSYKVIVNKSTVPIGSGDWVKMLVLDGAAENQPQLSLVGAGSNRQSIGSVALLEHRPSVQFDVVSNPEFLREGSAIDDTLNPDRIVLGSGSQRAIDLMLDLYAPIIDRSTVTQAFRPVGEAPLTTAVSVLTTDLGSAEMIKYAANAFLATKISFINEIANICERVGADVTQVSKGIGLDSRIGNKFLNAGIGWGGSCFPKDLAALIHTGADYGYDAQLLQATVNVNHGQRGLVIQKLQKYLKILKGKTVGILGLAFKPDTDDLRDAPALETIAMLMRLGVKVKAYDPIVTNVHVDLGGATLVSSPELLAADADAIVLMTEWEEFQQLDYQHLATLMRYPLTIDCRNLLSAEKMAEAGFTYVGIGR
jgi:UDPglucose 6-dehydrogenase